MAEVTGLQFNIITQEIGGLKMENIIWLEIVVKLICDSRIRDTWYCGPVQRPQSTISAIEWYRKKNKHIYTSHKQLIIVYSKIVPTPMVNQLIWSLK